jgi:hypothetical protein
MTKKRNVMTRTANSFKNLPGMIIRYYDPTGNIPHSSGSQLCEIYLTIQNRSCNFSVMISEMLQKPDDSRDVIGVWVEDRCTVVDGVGPLCPFCGNSG